MKKIYQIILLAFTFCLSQTSFATQHPGIDAYIQSLHHQYHFNTNKLQQLFAKVDKKDRIIQIIESPYEAKPWHIYRKHFLTTKRIDGGVEFWNAHQKALQLEEKRYGVPASVVVAIIGVESFYGKHKGKFRVIDALTTLAFYYPKRSAFFKKELTHFLIMCREKHIDPLTPTGSYAGAMGWPQFMPSSYRHYAVDFNNTGVSDIWNSPDDVIGSIGHYLYKNRWKAKQPIAMPVHFTGNEKDIPFNKGKRPRKKLSYWRDHGFEIPKSLPNLKANPLMLDMNDHKHYWLGFNNFYSIMSYNPRVHYAMAVYQLSLAIKHAHHQHH